MPNTSLPSGVAVLIDAPCPVSTWKPTPLINTVHDLTIAILYCFGMNLAPRFTDMQAQLNHLY